MTDVIDDMLSQLKAKKAKLYEEIRKIKAAEAALKGVASDVATSDKPTIRNRSRGGKTLKDMISAVLTEHGTGAEANDIISMIKDKFGKDVPRTSMSPQLTRMKNDDRKLKYLDGLWYLNEHFPEKPLSPLDCGVTGAKAIMSAQDAIAATHAVTSGLYEMSLEAEQQAQQMKGFENQNQELHRTARKLSESAKDL